jgi:hypothetical protein
LTEKLRTPLKTPSRPFYLTTLLCLLIRIVMAQDNTQGLDKVYGLDPSLYNGEIYSYFVESSTQGHQFLVSPEFKKGSVTIKGVTYENIQLNYDIFNQLILLNSQEAVYSNIIISLSKAWLERFTIGQDSFEVVNNQNTSPKIYQVIGNGTARELIFWTKEQKIDYYMGSTYYVFSKPKKEMYIQLGSLITRFRNNKTFISGFDKSSQSVISKYMHQHKVNVKKAKADSMRALITFCNTQIK